MGIAGWFFENNEAQSQRKLIILTNAGVTYSFIFRDLEFLDKVYAVLISSMAENRRAGQNIKINIKNSQIFRFNTIVKCLIPYRMEVCNFTTSFFNPFLIFHLKNKRYFLSVDKFNTSTDEK